MNYTLQKSAAVLALLIGVMSIVAGRKAMQGWNPGYSVLAWLPIYNFVMGILTLISVTLIWTNNRYAMAASLVTFGIHMVVLLLLLTVFRGEVATQSVAAMIFRLATWIAILMLMYFQAQKEIAATIIKHI